MACLVCILGCSAMAAAQDKTFSADALLATFQKGSPTSVRGAEIKFVGVISEVKRSRVVFKSSGDDKVLCELVTPLDSNKDIPSVGSSLTVIGRVRGRGMMGNVTLDPCVRTLAEPAPAPPPPPVVVPEPVLEKAEPPEVIAEPTPEPPADLPPPEMPKKPEVSGRIVSTPFSKVSPPKVTPAAEPVVEVAALDVVKPLEAPAPPQTVEVAEATTPRTIRFAGYLPLFIATAIGMGVGAFLVFMKMRPAMPSGFRSESAPTPEEERRAALEALLLGKKKRKK